MIYLLIGGPLHGSERHIDNGENEVTIMAPSLGNPIPSPFRYIRRDIQAETRPGKIFQRTVYVENSISPDVASQALAAIMLENFANELVRTWMEEGIEIGDSKESEPSGTDTERLQRSTAGSGNTPSGIIIASR